MPSFGKRLDPPRNPCTPPTHNATGKQYAFWVQSCTVVGVDYFAAGQSNTFPVYRCPSFKTGLNQIRVLSRMTRWMFDRTRRLSWPLLRRDSRHCPVHRRRGAPSRSSKRSKLKKCLPALGETATNAQVFITTATLNPLAPKSSHCVVSWRPLEAKSNLLLERAIFGRRRGYASCRNVIPLARNYRRLACQRAPRENR